MKCKFWDRLPNQYDEHCQCDGEIPLSSDAVLADVEKLMSAIAGYVLATNHCGKLKSLERLNDAMQKISEHFR